jgi:hypothetical protein
MGCGDDLSVVTEIHLTNFTMDGSESLSWKERDGFDIVRIKLLDVVEINDQYIYKIIA